jgi:hypothetical protein
VITRPDTNLYVSDAGFSVEVLGRTGLLYKEGERVMNVGSEVGPPGLGLAVWAKTIRAWRAPYTNEPVTDEVRERILRNIAEVVAFAKQPLTIMR